MNKNLIIVLLIGIVCCTFPVIGVASECVYGEGYSICGNAYTEGVKAYLRWDGVYRPYNELNFTNFNWTYKVEEFENYYLITVDNISFRLPKKNWISYDFQVNKIKETMHVPTLQALIDRSVVHNATVRYIPLEFSPSQVAQVNKSIVELGRFKTKDFWIRDNGTEFFDNETNSTYINYSYYDVENHYELKIIDGEIRLYFDDLPWFQNANYPLLIDPSWTLNGSIGTSWINVSHENTTSVQSTGNVELRQLVDDYVSYWRFDEGSGITAHDENVTSGHDGTLTNMDANDWVAGYHGGYALDFDGSNDYVDVSSANPRTYSEFTLQTWYKSADADVSDDEYIFDHVTDPWSEEITFGLTDDTGKRGFARLSICSGEAYEHYYSTTDVVDQQWHHLVVVRTNSRVKIYVDGVLDNDVADTFAGQTITVDTASGPWIGDSPGNTEQVHGLLDDVRFFNRSLSPTEINQTMNNSHHWSGNLTSIEKDAGSGYVWTKVRFGGDIPDGTNATIYFNSSSDNGVNDTWSGWNVVESNASTSTNYTIPTSYQEQYGLWRFKLNTNNSSITPEIHNVTSFSESESSYNNGSINGTVTSTGSFPIINATVTDGTRSTLSNISGYYIIEDVPGGNYTLTASASGYLTQYTNISVSENETIVVNFSLTPIITLQIGWNIFAWTNETTKNASYVASLIGSNCTYIVERNRTTGDYVSFNPSFPSVNNFNIERGLGYYVNVNNTTNIIISDLSSDYNTTLYYWWNIIGWTNSSNTTASYVFNSIGSNCTYITKRNETTGKYITYNPYVPDVNNFTVTIGYGCYVFMNNETIWNRSS